MDETKHLQTAASQLKRSATAVETGVDRNTELAVMRTLLAAERTYAAWVRTALAAMAAGVGSRALLAGVVPNWLAATTGSILILFSAFCLVAAVWREAVVGLPWPHHGLRRVPLALLIGINAFLALVALAALIGIWFYDP
jgi:putative membrane protein